MKVSELIEALQEILEVDGDWEVYAEDYPNPIEDVRIDKTDKQVVLE